MNPDKIVKYIPPAQEALCSFLATLLGREAPLKISEPVRTEFDEANIQSKAYLVLTAGASPSDRFAVMLDPRWLPLLSKSMLGEPIDIGEPGADDLLRELAAQAYGALRTQLASAGVTLTEVSFELQERGGDLKSSRFADELVEVPFSLRVDAGSCGGFVLLPADAAIAERLSKPNTPTRGDAPAAASRSSVSIAPAAFPDLGNESIAGDGGNSFSLLAEVELEVTVELGRRKIPLADVLRLTTGSVIELEKLVGEPLEVYANGRLIAEGEAVVIDEQFGIRITNLVSNRQRAKAFY